MKKEELAQIEKVVGIRTAILVDGAFFMKRYRNLYPPPYDNAKKVAENFYTMVQAHVRGKYLYRILYYDCYPFSKKILNNVSKKNIDFSKTNTSIFKINFFNELRKKRKLALRLGELYDGRQWIIRPNKMKELLKGQIEVKDLTDNDFYYDIRQKGVDIKIGIDIAALAYKKMVEQIILISGDSDFVPASKVARREGIDIVLDPMWHPITPSLFEHIDGLDSTCPKPKKN